MFGCILMVPRRHIMGRCGVDVIGGGRARTWHGLTLQRTRRGPRPLPFGAGRSAMMSGPGVLTVWRTCHHHGDGTSEDAGLPAPRQHRDLSRDARRADPRPGRRVARPRGPPGPRVFCGAIGDRRRQLPRRPCASSHNTGSSPDDQDALFARGVHQAGLDGDPPRPERGLIRGSIRQDSWRGPQEDAGRQAPLYVPWTHGQGRRRPRRRPPP